MRTCETGRQRRPLTATARSRVIVGVLLVACARPVRAQDECRRHGFWFGLGLGYGSAHVACDTCSSGPRLGGWDLSFDLGATPSPHVGLGVGGFGWLHGWKGDRLPAIDTWTVSLSYYPRIHGGPFVEAGVGLSHYMLAKGTGDPLESISNGTSPAAGTGVGYTLGVGWEVNGGSLTPRVTYAYGSVGTLHASDGATVATGWRQNLLLVELGFRGGLP